MNGILKTDRSPRALLRRQRRQLAEWLDEWNLEQALACADGQGPDPVMVSRLNGSATGETAAGSCVSPVEGQIRLLVPDTATTRRRPLYVLILANRPTDDLLAVPFGVFSKPAVPGEWRTGLRALPVRVLCLWNTRRIRRERIQRSWHVRNLDRCRLSRVRRLAADCFLWPAPVRNRFLSLAGGHEPLPCSRLGPPLVHPLDPRHEYLTEETGRLDDLGPPPAAVDGEICWRGCPLPGSLPPALRYEPSREPSLLKAAEPYRTYGSGSEPSDPK